MKTMDLCIGCGAMVLTLANSNRVTDQTVLQARYMPPGGCSCGILVSDEDPLCPVCHPCENRCHKCPPGLDHSFSFELSGQLKVQLTAKETK